MGEMDINCSKTFHYDPYYHELLVFFNILMEIADMKMDEKKNLNLLYYLYGFLISLISIKVTIRHTIF